MATGHGQVVHDGGRGQWVTAYGALCHRRQFEVRIAGDGLGYSNTTTIRIETFSDQIECLGRTEIYHQAKYLGRYGLDCQRGMRLAQRRLACQDIFMDFGR